MATQSEMLAEKAEVDTIKDALTGMGVDLQATKSTIQDVTTRQVSEMARFEDETVKQVINMKLEIQNLIDKANVTFRAQQTELVHTREDLAELLRRATAEATGHRADAQGLQRAVQELHDKAAGGWAKREGKIEALHQAAGASVQDLQGRVQALESGAARPSAYPGNMDAKGYGKGSYLPLKNYIPNTLKDDVNMWRRWKRKFSSFVDAQTPGMQGFLETVQKAKENADIKYVNDQYDNMGHNWIKDDMTKIYRALVELTEGQALQVVESAKEENGDQAWQGLHRWFEPSLKARQGQVMNDVSSMVKTKAKNVHETRTMVNELVSRMQIAEEITGERVHDTHSKSILLGFIDDLSRQNTIDLHGHETSFLDLKNGIIKLSNNAANSTSSASSTPMVIGAVTAADGAAQAQELYPYCARDSGPSGLR